MSPNVLRTFLLENNFTRSLGSQLEARSFLRDGQAYWKSGDEYWTKPKNDPNGRNKQISKEEYEAAKDSVNDKDRQDQEDLDIRTSQVTRDAERVAADYSRGHSGMTSAEADAEDARRDYWGPYGRSHNR
jgi:hypothetical protein